MVQNTTDSLKGLSVLIFLSEGVKMAVDTEQIEGVIELEQAREMQTSLMNIHGAPFHNKERLRDSRVLIVKDEVISCGIVVEGLQEITFINIDSIKLMPPLMEFSRRLKTIWGAFMKGADMIFLADLTILLRNK
jgi:chemotaxis signal transduction protein